MDFQDKLDQEILQTLDRRSKIDTLKISFVTALFGLGTIGKIEFGDQSNQVTLLGALYLAPFVSLGCDCFIMRETWSLRRIGHFLRDCGSPIEKRFEVYIQSRRNPFHRLGNAILTLVTIGASVWMLVYQKAILKLEWKHNDWAWVALSLTFWSIIHIGGWLRTKQVFEADKATS